LADPRLTGEQDDGAGHDPTAEHSVEFGDEGRLRLSQCGVDFVDRLRPAGLLDLGLHLRRIRTLFFEGAPGLALGAAPEPLDRRIAADGAGERHTAMLTRGADAGIADEKGRPTIGRPRPAVRQAVTAVAGQCGRLSVRSPASPADGQSTTVRTLGP